jgi:hypothetical protein
MVLLERPCGYGLQAVGFRIQAGARRLKPCHQPRGNGGNHQRLAPELQVFARPFFWLTHMGCLPGPEVSQHDRLERVSSFDFSKT